MTASNESEKWKQVVQDTRSRVHEVVTINVDSSQGGSEHWVEAGTSLTQFTAKLLSLKVKFEDDKHSGLLTFEGGHSFPFVFPPNKLML